MPRAAIRISEADSVYGLAVGGDTVFLRQNFPGTWSIHLGTSAGGLSRQAYRREDGGTWMAAVDYAGGSMAQRWPPGTVRTPSPSPRRFGHVGPAIPGGTLDLAESFAATRVEDAG